MKKAIFLDRDGTLIRDCGALRDPGQVSFYRGVFPKLRELQKNYLLFIVTNQPYVGKGMLKLGQVRKVHSFMLKKLRKERIRIRAVFCCPHKKEDRCACRKPSPYFLKKAEKRYSLDLKNSFVVGDHLSDMELAFNTGSRAVYVLTGHGHESYREIRRMRDKVRICRNLRSAADYILNE